VSPSESLISVARIKSCTIIANWHRQCVHGNRHGPVSGIFDVVVNAPGNSSVHVRLIA